MQNEVKYKIKKEKGVDGSNAIEVSGNERNAAIVQWDGQEMNFIWVSSMDQARKVYAALGKIIKAAEAV